MKYLITSALPYINGVKHLGNLVGSLLPADIYARFLRMSGEEVLYICATDEHGTPAEIAAQEGGMDVRAFCDEQHQIQKDIYSRFNLSFDHFGRSSSVQNKEFTQHIYKQLKANGFIEETEIQAYYSEADARFLPDRYIIGTCPFCGYEKARGDQCESCSKVLDPTDLKNPKSALNPDSKLEIRTTRHLFLKLPLLEGELKTWIDAHKETWPKLSSSIAYKWLAEGLQDRCITRDLSWGFPIPEDGYEDKRFYVWFDAPIEYIGATKELSDLNGTEDWKNWWLNNNDKVHYTQFLGKDNVPFHTIMFPAMILGTREKWKMADFVKGVSWLNYYDGKFSTSSKRGIFTDKALDLFPADHWRYALMCMIPETDDANFTWEFFQGFVNSDLANSFGNFINRTIKFSHSKFGTALPAGKDWAADETELEAKLQALLAEYTKNFRALEFRKVVANMREIWSLANVFIDKKAPWSELKTDEAAAKRTIAICINLIRVFAITAYPFIPATCDVVFESLGLKPEDRLLNDQTGNLRYLADDREIGLPPILFTRIEDAVIQSLKDDYKGS